MRRRWGIAAAALVLLGGGGYAAIRAVPGLVRDAAQDWVQTELPGKVLTIGDVAFDVWNLRLDIGRVAIADAAAPATPLVAADAISIDARPAALWTLSPRLDRLAITAPRVHAVIDRDGTLNLASLLPKRDADGRAAVPTVEIGELVVAAGRLQITDRRGAAPWNKQLDPVSLTLRDLATSADVRGQARLSARGDDGETLAWDGRIGLAPLASEGRFAIGALPLATAARLAGLDIGIGGRGTIAGRYRFALPPPARAAPDAPAPAPDLTLVLETAKFAQPDVTLASKTRLRARAAALAPTTFNLAEPVIALGDIFLEDAGIQRRDGLGARIGQTLLAGARYDRRSGQIATGALSVTGATIIGTGRGRGVAAPARIARLALTSAEIAPGDHRATLGALTVSGLTTGVVVADGRVTVPGLWPRPPARGAAGKSWSVSLAGLDLTDGRANLLIRNAGVAPRRLAVTPIDASLGPMATPFDRRIAIRLAARIDGRARLAVAGTAAVNGDADLAVALAGVPLARAAALAPPGPVLVRGGTFASRGRLRVAHGRPDFAGSLSVADLLITERATGDPLLSWHRLDLAGIRARTDRIAIARVGFDRLLSHIIVTRDQRLNLARVAGLTPPEDEVELPADTDAPDPDSVPQPPPEPVTPQPAAPAAVRVVAPISNTTAAAAKLIPISIGEVSVRRSSIDFTDQAIEPNFRVKIDGFAGSITNLDSRPGKLARFALKGYVGDRFAPASLTGRANPFAYDRDTDLTATFRNIELPLLNPYSGRWAGYAIARGKLTTTVHWRIVDRALNAEHRIIIDQLKWGPATGSKDKVPLPVRLASSLLKDRNGVITLDLPVKGTLDNPKFRIWPIVWRIVGNAIAKVALAPFKLLGGLFGGGGGGQAQFVGFAPGDAGLAPDNAEALGRIAKGLVERPDLNLDIPAGPAGREDAAVLARLALEAAVLKQKGGKPAPDFASLALDTRRDRLKAVYKARLGKAPKPPDPPDGTRGDAARAFAADWLFAQLLPVFAPGDAALAELGRLRAETVQRALLAGGEVAPERVFINTGLVATMVDDKVQLELKIRE